MNSKAIWAIARKDMRAITANLQVWLPMLILPLVLGVILPSVIIGLLSYMGLGGGNNLQQMLVWLDKLPAGTLKSTLDAFTSPEQKVAFMVANYLLTPFFLLIPLMTSSVISADSFAGEKERGTLETLLFAPVDLLSMLLGKMLAAFLPSVGLSLVTLALCAVSVNAFGWKLFGQRFFPTVNWLPLMLLVIPMISLLAILLGIFISARVATFQAAYQMGGVVVLPFVLLLFGQVTGVVLMSFLTVCLIGLALAAIDVVLIRLLYKRLDRNLLFESQVR